MADTIAPQKTGYLNPSVESATTDYTGYSRGIEEPRAQRYSDGQNVALSGLGELWTQLVDTVDKRFTGAIKDEVRDEHTALNQRITGPIPDGVTAGVNQAKSLNSARQQGTISEGAYWMRLEALSRSLKSRYAGHAETVDKEMSAVTGGVPANKIREYLFDQASKGGDSDPTQKLFNANMQHLNADTIDNVEKKGVYPAYNVLQAEIARNKVAAEQDTRDQAALNLDEGRTAQTKRRASESLGRAYNTILSRDVAPVVAELNKQVEGFLGGGSSWTPEAQKNITAAVMAGRQKLEYQLRLTAIGKGPYSKINYSEYLDNDAIEAKAKPIYALLDSVTQAVVGKDADALQINSRLLTAIVDGETLRMVDNDESMLRMAAVAKVLPPDVMKEAAFRDLRDKKGNIIASQDEGFDRVAEYVWSGLTVDDNPTHDPGRPTPQPLSEALTEQKKAGNLNGRNTNKILNRTVDTLIHPGTPLPVLVTTAKNVFDDPIKFLEVFDGKETGDNGPKVSAKVQAWYAIGNSSVAKNMQKVREQDPATYEKYQKWMIDGANVVLGKSIANMREVVVDDRHTVKMNWNATTSNFSLDLSAVSDGDKRTFEKNWQKEVTQFNMAIAPIVSMFKAEGGPDVDAKILGTLQLAGFDKDEPKQTIGTLKSMWQLARQATAKVWEKAFPTPAKLGRTETTEGGGIPSDNTPRLDSRHNTELEGLSNEFDDLMEQMKKNPTEVGLTQLHQLHIELQKARAKALIIPTMEPTSGTFEEMK